jgi:hypothetical protein
MSADPREAYYHFRVATLQGGEQASRMVAYDLQILTAKLGAEQTQAIDRDASAWFQNHPLSLEFVFKDGEKLKEFPASALETTNGNVHAGRLIATGPS